MLFLSIRIETFLNRIHLLSNRVVNGMESDRYSGTRVSRQIHGSTARRFLRNLAFGGDHQMRKYTLFVLLCCGLAGVLIDLDHLLIEETQMVRPFHLPIWVGVCLGSIGYYAYLHRRVHYLGVSKKREHTKPQKQILKRN